MTARSSKSLLSALRLVAPGTPLREGLDRILLSKMGALVVVGDSPEILAICSGGFLLDAEFSPQRLSELAKMDGAIILSTDGSRIARANVHLLPDVGVPTTETGTRHRTAERTARSVGWPVISVSEEMSVIAVYRGAEKRQVEPVDQIMRRSTQAISTLEKFRQRMDTVLAELSQHEVDNHVTVRDVAAGFQRCEMVRRLGDEVDTLVVELGDEGRLASLQQQESLEGVDRELDLLRRDYGVTPPKGKTIDDVLSKLTTEDLGDLALVARTIGLADQSPTALQQLLHPKGHRLLARVPRLSDQIIDHVAEHFDDLALLLKATASKLTEVESVGEVRARAIRDGLTRVVENTQTNTRNR
jgi:diadenylate cyclase